MAQDDRFPFEQNDLELLASKLAKLSPDKLRGVVREFARQSQPGVAESAAIAMLAEACGPGRHRLEIEWDQGIVRAKRTSD